MAAEYNRYLILLIAVVQLVLLLLVLSNYTTPVPGHRVDYIHSSMNSTTTTTQKEKQDHLIHAEKLDQNLRRSIALAALDPDDPSKFLYLVRKYCENAYYIHPVTKKLVRVYVNHRMEVLHRCRRCPRPAPITEADWKRYEAAVKRPPSSCITSLDVSRYRLWLEANPPPL